jgi:hypothetical protein
LAGPKAGASDINARLARIEEHLERLTREIEELHAIIGKTRAPGRSEPTTTGERPQGSARERQPSPPANMRLRDRWNSDENRFQQGDLSGARQRSRAAAIQRADRANVAAQQRADEREAEEFAKRAQPSQRPPGAAPAAQSSKNGKPATNGGDAKSPNGTKRGEAATETELPIPGDDKTK